MDSERWKQIDEIFHAALDREPAARAAFLAEACKEDVSLRAEIETLIASHEKESSLFETPPSELAAEFLAKDQKDKIAHYQILKKIGSGGMGEVYLAEDTRLNRKVALKILPSEFTNDKDRVRRFEREARTVTALNHPNIITIYDIGQMETSSFIVTEYIDGETLRQRMRTSQMHLKEILPICIQATEALDAAHQAGVIHRDIKPENIMIRKDGYVKVLDFGLAKSIDPPNNREASTLDTRSMAHTGMGVVIGTVRYMSPEQARGLKIDPRTDIFSLGVVLYEMIAGRSPFDAATSQDTLAAILQKNPPALRTYVDVPDELQWIVMKALSKDVEERYQGTKDFLTDLKRIRKRLEIDEELKRSGSTGIAQPVQKKITRVAIVFALLIAAAIIAFFLNRLSPKKMTATTLPFNRIKVTRLTSSGSAFAGAISPDGKYTAYFQTNDQNRYSIYVKQLLADTDLQILTIPENTAPYDNLLFSIDGQYLFYLLWSTDEKRGSLYQIPVLGGVPRKVLQDIVVFPALSPDGKKFAFVRKEEDEYWLMVSQNDGSNQKKIANRKLTDQFGNIAWSPDGKIITTLLRTNLPSGIIVKVVGFGLDGSQQWQPDLKWIAEYGIADLKWISNGSGLVLSKGQLGKQQIYYLSYPKGELTQITNDPNDYRGVSINSDFNSLVTTQYSHSSSLWTASTAKPESALQVSSGLNTDEGSAGLSWTPDGKILFQSKAPTGEFQIWRANPDATNRIKLTSDERDKYWPVASPDGKYIVYNTVEDKLMKLWKIDSDGSNLKLLSGTKPMRFPKISLDSKWILCFSADVDKQEAIRLSLDGSKATVLASNIYSAGGAISPDGTQIAYVTESQDESQKSTLRIISSDNGAEIRNVILKSPILGNRIHWTPDGRGIAYVPYDQKIFNIYIQPINGSDGNYWTNFTEGSVVNFSWSFDGKKIVYSRFKNSIDIVLIQNVP